MHFLGGIVGVGAQRLGTTLAITVRVDHYPHLGWPVVEHDPLREMLDRVDRLSAAADEQADVLALQAALQHALGLVDLDLHIEAESVGDLRKQVLEHLHRIVLVRRGHIAVVLDVAHRRLPERFFFLRGGGGGAAPAPANDSGAGEVGGLWRYLRLTVVRTRPPSIRRPSPATVRCAVG